MSDKPNNLAPPRRLRGRKERMLWRSLAPLLAKAERFHAGTRPLLAAYCTALASIERDPGRVASTTLFRARTLGKALGL